MYLTNWVTSKFNNVKEEIRKFFKGEIFDEDKALDFYSHDASIFRVKPKLVVFPQGVEDLKNLVKWINQNKGNSITIRAAGTDMSGGPLNESIIANVTEHMDKMGEIVDHTVTIEPGVFYKDFEIKTLQKNLILPCYTASKDLCALGGMIANNSGGEKTLRYGKMENFVLESKVILSDGNEYTIKPLDKSELDQKMNQNDFEGRIYKQIFELISPGSDV